MSPRRLLLLLAVLATLAGCASVACGTLASLKRAEARLVTALDGCGAACDVVRADLAAVRAGILVAGKLCKQVPLAAAEALDLDYALELADTSPAPEAPPPPWLAEYVVEMLVEAWPEIREEFTACQQHAFVPRQTCEVGRQITEPTDYALVELEAEAQWLERQLAGIRPTVRCRRQSLGRGGDPGPRVRFSGVLGRTGYRLAAEDQMLIARLASEGWCRRAR